MTLDTGIPFVGDYYVPSVASVQGNYETRVSYRSCVGRGISLAITALRPILCGFRTCGEQGIWGQDMNLVKWFRKNNKKLMAVVVVVLMVGFVGGSALQQLLSPRRGRPGQTVGYYGDRKISRKEVLSAAQELEMLQMLRADTVLRSLPGPRGQTLDLHGMLLGELLFSDRAVSAGTSAIIKRSIGMNQYRISLKQLNEMYDVRLPNHVYWLLLTKEAEQAGMGFPNEECAQNLATIIPMVTGASYTQVMEAMVDRFKVPEERILSVFAKLLSVVEYSRFVCGMEDVTTRQLQNELSKELETVDVEFVRFESKLFSEEVSEPSEEEIGTQFEKYKGFMPGEISEANPYGLGYYQPDRVRLDYIGVKLEDLGRKLAKPTQDQMQHFYQDHEDRFTVEVPSDANDPNSELVQRTRSYAEVANAIFNALWREKKNSKAELILQEARGLTEVGVEELLAESEDANSEQLKEAAGDYATAAKALADKHDIKVYVGQTGLLSADDMLRDSQLRRSHIRGYGDNRVALSDMVFAIDELGGYELGQFEAPKPRLYGSIGPVWGPGESFVMLVRVTEAVRATEPEKLDLRFSSTTLDFENEDGAGSEGEPVYSVREKVIEDLKKLAAMEVTRGRAEQFKALAESEGWEAALEQFNAQYGESDANEPDVNAAPLEEAGGKLLRVQTLSNLRRFSRLGMRTLAVQGQGNPLGQSAILMGKKEGKLRELFYSLVPADSNEGATPQVLEFNPDLSYYVLKKVSVNRLGRAQYEQLKSARTFQADAVCAQSLAAVHFNPENIAKRLKFRGVEQESARTDANEPPQRQESS